MQRLLRTVECISSSVAPLEHASFCLVRQLLLCTDSKYLYFVRERLPGAHVAKIRKAIKAVKRRGDIKKRKFNESIDLQFVLKRHNWRNEEPVRGTIRLKHAPNIVKFGMKKAGAVCIKVGWMDLTVEQILDNIVTVLNFIIELLPKRWGNIRSIISKSTMGPAHHIY